MRLKLRFRFTFRLLLQPEKDFSLECNRVPGHNYQFYDVIRTTTHRPCSDDVYIARYKIEHSFVRS